VSWRDVPWLCIDVETTGFSRNDRIVEVAGVWMRGGEVCDAPDGGPGRRGTLINPGMPIPWQSTEIHHITDDMVADKPTIEQVAESFCAHVKAAHILVAYNASFDMRFLDVMPGFAEAREGKPVIDPLMLVRRLSKHWQGGDKNKLTGVMRRINQPMPGNAHRASADAIAAGMVLWHYREHHADPVHLVQGHQGGLL